MGVIDHMSVHSGIAPGLFLSLDSGYLSTLSASVNALVSIYDFLCSGKLSLCATRGHKRS